MVSTFHLFWFETFFWSQSELFIQMLVKTMQDQYGALQGFVKTDSDRDVKSLKKLLCGFTKTFSHSKFQ